MLYDVHNKNYYNFSVYEKHKFPPRTYFIPFSSRELADAADIKDARYKSDKVVCLNGEWDFVYYQSDKEMPKNFDTSDVKFGTIDVPSCWQFRGIEPPFYINTRYQFRCRPPKIPTTKPVGRYSYIGWDRFMKRGLNILDVQDFYNSVGVYRQIIDVDTLNEKYILSFLGGAGCMDLFVNGSFVGFSEGAHNTAEFDVSPYLTEGTNELLVVVHKFCNGSYIECQDMFRNNGIFRDVLMFVDKKQFIYDIDFKTKKTKEGYTATAEAVVPFAEKCRVRFTLEKDGNVLATAEEDVTGDSASVQFDNLDVIEWNAEKPTLYTMYYELLVDGEVSECIKKHVGFKTIVIDGDVFKLNGVAIKLKGVNHHDTDAKNGWCMTADELERDVKLLKEFGGNCMRMSHYPPDPVMLELCDRYGIYVVDEADIESHGTVSVPFGSYNTIPRNLKWKDRFWDRVLRMFQRDKMAASVVMWSLGNEAGGIKCHDYCYENLKALTKIPIHYEGACRTKRMRYDVMSMMYPEVSAVRQIADKTYQKRNKKVNALTTSAPFFMCEYAHAMGVGPGGIEDYWKAIYEYPSLLGGCVWEMNDHAVYHEDGKYKYTYGGDHGEFAHDRNFCVDGMFHPDRTPSSGAYEMKYVYRPIVAEFLGDDKIRFTNRMDFTDADVFDLKFTVRFFGQVEKCFMGNISLKPHESDIFEFGLGDIRGDKTVDIEYIEKTSQKTLFTEQLQLSTELSAISIKQRRNAVEYFENSSSITVHFYGGKAIFQKAVGSMISYEFGGVQYMSEEPSTEIRNRFFTNIWRAPTDNDVNISEKWEKHGYDAYTIRVTDITAQTIDDNVNVRVQSKLVSPKMNDMFSVEDNYLFYPSGKVMVTSQIMPLLNFMPELPRFGKAIELNSSFDQVIYYGREGESYPDMKNYSPIGVYEKTVKEMQEFYIKPQESGAHADTRFVTVKNSTGHGFFVLAIGQPFSFSVRRRSDITLSKMGHIEDAPEGKSVYLDIDSVMQGLGSNSCGPYPDKEFLYKPNKPYEISFALVPTAVITKVNEKVMREEQE